MGTSGRMHLTYLSGWAWSMCASSTATRPFIPEGARPSAHPAYFCISRVRVSLHSVSARSSTASFSGVGCA